MDERKNTITEEAAAVGQRAKGAVKDAAGAVTGNDALEREGERENQRGRERQAANDVGGGTWRNDSGYVTGLYRTPEDADRAYSELTSKHGYAGDDIDVLMSDDTRARYYAKGTPGENSGAGSKSAEGLGIGAAVGGGVGAALAAIFAVGSNVLVPGLGLVVSGPIAAALAGAGAGGATGGIVGALVGAGIPEDRARDYETGLREGGIVIGTKARDAQHAAQLERDYESFGGSNVKR